MFKGPRKIVRDNKSSSYLVFELMGVNCTIPCILGRLQNINILRSSQFIVKQPYFLNYFFSCNIDLGIDGLLEGIIAPTSMAYRSTSKPLDFIPDFNGKYLLMLWSYYFSIFYSQRQVNSISITFLAESEYMVMSGCSSV